MEALKQCNFIRFPKVKTCFILLLRGKKNLLSIKMGYFPQIFALT